MMNQFVHSKFVAQYKTTIGSDFAAKDLLIDHEPVTMQVGRDEITLCGRFGTPQDRNGTKA